MLAYAIRTRMLVLRPRKKEAFVIENELHFRIIEVYFAGIRSNN